MAPFLCAISILVVGQGASSPRELHGVVPYDVVHLLKTERRMEGKKSLQLVRYGYEYHFGSEANRSEFLRQPQKYEVQLGGACGRMGLLTGHGSPERYAILNGKLYFFASDGCRKSFLAKPHESIEGIDTPFASDAKGISAMNRALRWMGGREALAAITAYKCQFIEVVPSTNQTYRHVYTIRKSFPDFAEISDQWNDSAWISHTSKDDSYIKASNGRYRDMHPDEQAALRRLLNRDLISMMRAFAQGKAKAKFLNNSSGVESIAVYHEQTRNVIEIDSASGAILATEFFGKTPSSYNGKTRFDFVAWKTVRGIQLPTAWAATHNGKLHAGLSRKGLTWQLNEAVADREH